MTGLPIGLDFAAIMLTGAAQAADLELLSEVLPDFEGIVIASLSPDGPVSSDSEEFA
jgi:hypothetical protein